MANLFLVNTLKTILFLPVWWFEGIKRRDPKTWVFGAWYGDSYSDNCRNLYEYVVKNHKEIHAVWITRSQAVYDNLKSRNLEVALADSKEGRRICREAKYGFISNTIFDVNEMHVNGMTRIWIWHGHPLKKIVNDQPKPKQTIKDKIRTLLPPFCKPKADIVPNTSSFFSPYYQTAFSVKPSQILITGYPRNDSLFENETTPFMKELKQKYQGARIILYMPTFRDTMYQKGKAFDPFAVHGFNSSVFSAFLKRNNLVFLYKGHYVDIQNQELKTSEDQRFIFVNESMYDNLYSFVKDSDILVTDYSSIYFDYLLLKKPIILTPFDKEEYCSQSRPFYYDYDENIDAVQATDWGMFMKIVEKNLYYVPNQSVLDKYHFFQDGNSSKRITDYILSLK
jgi:CDP-glycerol glycerophosphotransferase